MRHKKARLQFNRFTSWHKATIRSLVRSILISQSIKTTTIKAKAVRPVVDKLIASAKADTLAARRMAFAMLQDHALVKALFTDIAPRFKDQASGFTRIINYGVRRGDNAKMAIFELTQIKKKELPKPKKVKEDVHPKEETPEIVVDAEPVDEKPHASPHAKEKHLDEKKPAKKMFSGIKGIFKKERGGEK